MNSRDENLTFYGPYACENCYLDMPPDSVRPHVLIVKVSREQGGEEFDYPSGPIYPNTPWKSHVHRVLGSVPQSSGSSGEAQDVTK